MINVFIRLGSEVFVLNKFRNYFLIKELSSFLNNHNKHLPSGIKSRILSYTKIASIPGLWFSGLRGYKPDRDEIMASLYLGALTPVFDDLLDSEGYTYNEVLEAKGIEKNVNTESLLLFKYLKEEISGKVKYPELYYKYMRKTAEAQMMSIRQKNNSNLTTEEIKDITYKKGGYATLLYRSLLSNKLIPGEEEAVYTLGGLLQLMNDIFDIYKDYKCECQTLATTASNINLLRQEYTGMINKTLSLFRRLDYPAENTKRALDRITIVTSRGFVCLNQLLALQERNGVFNLRNFTRRDLVCDMEKIPNIRQNLVISREIKKGQLP